MTKIEYEKQIEKLFKDWQSKEVDSFTTDGAISPEDYFLSEKRIVFVAKESNLKDGKNFKGEFWLKNVCEGKEKPAILSRRIVMLANAALQEDFERPNKSQDNLKKIAFMNLNKSGGFSKCDWNTLKNYVEKYSTEISKEIEILDPTIIICTGKGVKALLEKAIGKGKYKIAEVYHPSYYFKSDGDHLKKLEKELRRLIELS